MDGFNNAQLTYLLNLLENNPTENVISEIKNKINERIEEESRNTKTLKSKLEKYLGKYVKITYETHETRYFTHETRYFKLEEISVSRSYFNYREDLSLKSRFQVFIRANNEKTIESYDLPVCVVVINKDTDFSIIQEITYEEFNNVIENVISNGRIQ